MNIRHFLLQYYFHLNEGKLFLGLIFEMFCFQRNSYMISLILSHLSNIIQILIIKNMIGQTIPHHMCFFTLIPFLNPIAIREFQISGQQIKQTINKAVEQSRIKTVIGGLSLLFLKNSLANLSKQFPIVHLSNLDRVFFLVSQHTMNNRIQNDLYYLVKLVIEKWLKETPRKTIQKFFTELKEQMNIYQKALQYVHDQKQEKKSLTISLLKIFVTTMQNQKTKAQNYQKKFQDHGHYLYKNKKQLYFLNLLYEIQFSVLKELHSHEELYNSDYLVSYVEKKLFSFSSKERFSVVIQNMSFLMRKLFIINRQNKISKQVYTEFLSRIEEKVDKFFSSIKLSQKTNFFFYHMKNNNFFYYLDKIFDPNVKRQYKIINIWRKSLADAILEALPEEQRALSQDDIEETIFFMQLRDRASFLWGKSLEEINQFPMIKIRIVKRHLQKSLKNSSNTFIEVKEMIKENRLKDQFNKSNIFSQAIIFYYVHYYQNYSFISQGRQSMDQNLFKKILDFKNHISNQQLIKLIQFYILQLQLGNYYDVQKNSEEVLFQNSVNYLIYSSCVNMLHVRIIDILGSIEELESVEDIVYLKILTKYLVILIKALHPNFSLPFICKSCKLLNSFEICIVCEYICLGFQLYPSKICKTSKNDKFFHQQMLNSIQSLVKKKLKLIHRDTNPIKSMISQTIRTLIPIQL